ncbi:MAG: hypothetical protein FWG09_04575 [Synergistaceae bacterium]|nr:hypothetical protein [Synergistaceae bacterium]
MNISYERQTKRLLAGRNTKMWELMKYLLAFYPAPVTVDRLIDTVCPEGEDGDLGDRSKNVRNIIYRLRKAFISIGSKQEYILHVNGCYLWNPDAECFIDFAEFNRFLHEAENFDKSDEERISSYNSAISLYGGEFMGEKWPSLKTWTSNFVSYYRRSFLRAVENLSSLYERRLDYENIIKLHNKALLIEPYEETLYARLVQVLIKNGEYVLAERQYRQMEKIFAREFDAAPSQTLQELYEEAARFGVRQPAALSRIKEMFDERAKHDGPIFCAPDTFTQIYSYGKMVEERVTLPVFLCKVTLLTDGKTDFTKADLEKAMKTLSNILLHSLRKGDIVCRYSQNQFLMMLTTVNAANLREGLQRIDLIFRKESEFSQIRLEMEIVPIKNVMSGMEQRRKNLLD